MASLPVARQSRVLLAALVVVHLVVVSRQVDAGGGHSLLQQAVFGLLYPVQVAVSRSVAGLRQAWQGYVDLRGVREQNGRLSGRVAELELQLQAQRTLAQETLRLRALLELEGRAPAGAVAAEVVERGGLPWFRTLILDKGKRHGVALDAPVISPSGVIGRVIEVAPGACKVQVLSDHQSGVGVLVERSRVPAVVSGQIGRGEQGSPELRVDFVPARSDVRVGDLLVTSGLDGIFPKGLLVGQISQVQSGTGLFQEVLASAAADFVTVESVLVLQRQPEPELRAQEPPQ